MKRRAQEAERNVTQALSRIDMATEDKVVQAESRAKQLEQENLRLQDRLDRALAGLRKWIPEEDWHQFE